MNINERQKRMDGYILQTKILFEESVALAEHLGERANGVLAGRILDISDPFLTMTDCTAGMNTECVSRYSEWKSKGLK